MILYHATPSRNEQAILREGLLTAMSQTAQPEVWLHSASRSAWAILHVADRHGVPAEEVILLAVRISRRALRRRCKRGLWSTAQDVPASTVRYHCDSLTIAR